MIPSQPKTLSLVRQFLSLLFGPPPSGGSPVATGGRKPRRVRFRPSYPDPNEPSVHWHAYALRRAGWMKRRETIQGKKITYLVAIQATA
jgi:hypothetical protein